MYVLIKCGDYIQEVKIYYNLNDAQDKMIEMACEEYEVTPSTFEELEEAILPNGSIDAMFADMGTPGCAVFQIFEVQPE